MKRLLLFILAVLSCTTDGFAQKKDFSFKFYGRVRGDLFYNSRANGETVDGLFHLYPKDHDYDANGNDLNASPNGSFYVIYTRLGLDIAGPQIGSAKAKAKIEVDFRGSGSNWALLRIRHAYVNLDWGKSQFLLGQTWHPMFGDVSPQILNLNTGAPFQPFNRSPQIRYRYTNNGWELTGSALWQLQYTSAGPAGKSESYIKNSCVPEFYFGINHKQEKWMTGVGMEILSLKPRKTSTIDDKIYKVNERINSLSFEAHAKYKSDNWFVAGKTLLTSNMTQTSTLGGFAVTGTDKATGENTYTPYRHSMSWINIVYGKKWKPGIFVGYLKNLGTGKDITGPSYGTGLEVDQLFRTDFQLSYNLPHWKLGMEYTPSIAWFGEKDMKNGRINSDHSVCNHRVLAVLLYMF